MDPYRQLIERIANSAKIPIEEIDRKVEAKRAKLSGLVSKEGAAQIVAAELGVNLDQERIRVSEIVPGMKRAHIFGKITEVFPVRSYNKNGREGKVATFTLADENGNVRVVLWDTNHIRLIENSEIKLGDVIELSNAMVRNGELHLSSFGDIKLSKEIIGEVKIGKVFSPQKLKDAKSGQKLSTRAFIVQVFDPRYFEVCPECGKKVLDNQCVIHGNVSPKKRALLNFVLDDGSETIRGVAFNEQILKLGVGEEELYALEKFAEKKHDLLGDEKIFSGTIRTNAIYNNTEFIVENIEDIMLDNLIKEFENKRF